MILLIPNISCVYAGVDIPFKFHYDSINSNKFVFPFAIEKRFKFHYDSINSQIEYVHREHDVHLNSIMILLILVLVLPHLRSLY